MTPELQANRAILLTPVGKGAIAVIRLIGPDVDSFLTHHLSRRAAVGRLAHGELRDRGDVIDDPIVARVAEHIVDLNVHGGTWIVQWLFNLAEREGFQQIDATEPPLPNDAVDSENEIEREVLQWLPNARTESAVRWLLQQPVAWESLLSEPIDLTLCRQVLNDPAMHWLLSPPRVAIIGPPNVGKSTLANRLFGTARSITADVPGTTRDWVGDIADVGELAVMLLDTPGERQNGDAIEMRAIDRARLETKSVDAIILVGAADDWADPTFHTLRNRHPAAVVVASKIDRHPTPADENVIGVNNLTGDGIDRLCTAVRQIFGCESLELTRPCCWTGRQRSLLLDRIRAAECPDT